MKEKEKHWKNLKLRKKKNSIVYFYQSWYNIRNKKRDCSRFYLFKKHYEII